LRQRKKNKLKQLIILKILLQGVKMQELEIGIKLLILQMKIEEAFEKKGIEPNEQGSKTCCVPYTTFQSLN
jgi:hypothetical protein